MSLVCYTFLLYKYITLLKRLIVVSINVKFIKTIIKLTVGKLPSTQLVEKKAMFRVSRGLSWVHSGDLVWGSDSPVRDELSTWKYRKTV